MFVCFFCYSEELVVYSAMAFGIAYALGAWLALYEVSMHVLWSSWHVSDGACKSTCAVHYR